MYLYIHYLYQTGVSFTFRYLVKTYDLPKFNRDDRCGLRTYTYDTGPHPENLILLVVRREVVCGRVIVILPTMYSIYTKKERKHEEVIQETEKVILTQIKGCEERRNTTRLQLRTFDESRGPTPQVITSAIMDMSETKSLGTFLTEVQVLIKGDVTLDNLSHSRGRRFNLRLGRYRNDY